MKSPSEKNMPSGNYSISESGGEQVRSFIPHDLMTLKDSVDLACLLPRITAAERALGRLDGVSSILPNTPLFLYMYVRKEALLSAQIEGTQSSLSDLLLFEGDESPSVSMDDVEEVSNYVAAMNYGLAQMKSGFPLSNRLLRNMHKKLLDGVSGGVMQPGEFRTTQNWIGGTRPGNATYVPPPAENLLDLMSDLESFLHLSDTEFPALIKAALAHVQFESIHPFLDGNGRLGRLLITLLLVHDGVLSEPLLYLSLYLKTHRRTYYELLQRVREEGSWIQWLEFFLEGVRETSEQAASAAKDLLILFEKDQKLIATLGRPTASALRVHDYFQTRPVSSVQAASRHIENMSLPTIRKSIQHLVDLEILTESTGKKRNQIYTHSQYLQILRAGTEPN